MNHDALLLDLYACPTTPARWPLLLDRLCAETGACSAVVQAFRLEGDRLRPQWQAMDRHTGKHQALPQALYASTENPRVQWRRSLRVLNRVVGDDEIFERDDPAKQELQRNLASIGLGAFLGSLQPLDDGIYIAVALHRALGDGEHFNAAAVSRLEGLSPHVRQACSLARQWQTNDHHRRALQEHLDHLRCGLLLCDAAGRLHWGNRSARHLLAQAGGLRVQHGALAAHGSADTMALRNRLERAGTQPCFLSLGEGDNALHLVLRSVPAPQDFGDTDGRCVLIAITRVGDNLSVPAETWSSLLGVTAAEANLVATLVKGGTVEQHAAHRGVSAGTVRCQLKQLLSKTGTHRQAELVKLALSSAAAHVLESLPAHPS